MRCPFPVAGRTSAVFEGPKGPDLSRDYGDDPRRWAVYPTLGWCYTHATKRHDGNAEFNSHSIESPLNNLQKLFSFDLFFPLISICFAWHQLQQPSARPHRLWQWIGTSLAPRAPCSHPQLKAMAHSQVFTTCFLSEERCWWEDSCIYVYVHVWRLYIQYRYIYILSYIYISTFKGKSDEQFYVYTSEAESWNIKYHEDGALCQNEAVDASLAVNQQGSSGPGSKREHVLALSPYFRLKTMKFLTCLVFLPGWIAGKNNNKQKVEHIAVLFPNKQQSWLSPRCVYTIMLGNRPQKKIVAPKVPWTA